MNEKVHIDLDGNLIPVHDQEYIWLGSLIGRRKLTNVALTSDAAVVTDGDPYEAAYNTLSALKRQSVITSWQHSLYLGLSVYPSIMTLS